MRDPHQCEIAPVLLNVGDIRFVFLLFEKTTLIPTYIGGLTTPSSSRTSQRVIRIRCLECGWRHEFTPWRDGSCAIWLFSLSGALAIADLTLPIDPAEIRH